MRELTDEARAAVAAIIAAHTAELARIDGFLRAEPGFAVIDGQLVREPAIIVYVAAAATADAAPATLDGIRVAVVQPDPWTAIDLMPQTRDLAAALDAVAVTLTPYEPLPGNPIDRRVTIEHPILCSVGPDAGWIVLKHFLAATRHKLTVAMYDFSADYIAKSLINAATAHPFRTAMTLDDSIDASERAIQDRLVATLGTHYSCSVILCGPSRRFPSAYHPKVAVQDDKRFWLSSGNWSPHSQPQIDPIGDPASAVGMYAIGNRDWHLVIDDAPLAKLFERYILHDKAAADGDPMARGLETSISFPDLFVPVAGLMALGAADASRALPPPPQPPARLPAVPRHVSVQPLLSPDNYAPRVAAWIKGAQHSLHLQYAYINYSVKPQDAAFRNLLDWLGVQSWRADFDLRIIVGNYGTDKLRLLAEHGFNDKVLRVQQMVHNKGVIRDGNQVLVSSQNWSGDGFLRNRDAGLIIDDAEIAAYYDKIFVADWEFRAQAAFALSALPAIIAPPGDTPPPGMVRMSWSEYFGE